MILDGALDRLDETAIRAQVRARLDEIVAVEGPIEGQRLASLVGQSFGLMRVRQARTDELLAMVPADRRHRESDDEFVWPNGMSPEGYQLVRVSEDVAHRPIDAISRVELGNAVRHVLSEPQRMRRDELRHAVMALFGFRREGATIRARLNEVIDGLASRGEVHTVDGFVLLDE